MTDNPQPIIDFEALLPYWINRASFLLRREVQERMAAAGVELSAEEMAILIQVLSEPGQTPSSLADRTVRDRTTVTRLLDGMVRKKLVTRHADEGDRRRVIVRPTDEARRTAEKIVPVVHGLIADCTSGIGADRLEAAREVLRDFTGNLLDMRRKS